MQSCGCGRDQEVGGRGSQTVPTKSPGEVYEAWNQRRGDERDGFGRGCGSVSATRAEPCQNSTERYTNAQPIPGGEPTARIEAVKPCTWLRPATGPISPAAKKPATA